MQAALVLDQWADPASVPQYLTPSIKWKLINGKREAYFPAGTIYEGDHAILICNTGQGRPIDEECAKAVGKTELQLQDSQLEYKMDSLGIHDKGDRELYRAGVILGYDENQQHIPGPNWDAYNAAKSEVMDKEESI